MGEIIHSRIVDTLDTSFGKPFALTVGISGTRLEAAWKTSSSSTERAGDPAVAILDIIREYPGAPIMGMSAENFNDYKTGAITLDTLNGDDSVYIQYPGKIPLNLNWELVGKQPVERSTIILVGICAANGAVERDPILLFDTQEWDAWLAGVNNYEFDAQHNG